MVTSPRRTARSKPPAPPTTHAAWRGKQAAIVVVVGVAAAGTVAAIILSGHETSPVSTDHIVPASRARTYSQTADCLLTDPTGLQSPLAAAVWDGMQAASATTHAQVSYLTIQGPDTIANAEVYINTLAMRGCSVVIAAGQIPTEAALARATAWPHQRMATVTSTAPTGSAPKPGNLTRISGSTTSVTTQVKNLLTAETAGTAPTS